MNTKLILSITLLFFSLTALSQVNNEETNKKGKNKVDNEIEKGKESKEDLPKEKACNPDDPKRPLTKKDLNDLAEQFKLLQDQVRNLKTGVDEIPFEVNKQYTKLKELQDSLAFLAESNKKLEELLKSSIEKNSNAEIELTKANDRTNIEKNKNSDLLGKIDASDNAYDRIILDYVVHCKSPDNSTIDLMKTQSKKTETKTKLDEFKKQAAELEFATKLLQSPNISKEDFSKAQLTLANLTANPSFLGLQEFAKEIKVEYDRFIDLCLRFEEIMQENVRFTNPKFRGDEVYADSEKYIYALKPYPYLEKKFEDALTDPNCKLGIPLK